MKKIIAPAMILTALLLPALASCTTYSSSFSNVWYKTADSKRYNDTDEKLEYEVTFREGSNTSYSVTYETGTYSLEFFNTMRNEQSTYCLKTEFAISGKITVNGEEKEFSDSVSSECYFLNASKTMQPVYSKKTVKSTSPVAQKANSLSEAYKEYDYTVICDYNATCTSVAYTYTDNLNAENSRTETVSLSSSYTTLDNEELLFVARGLSVDSSEPLYVFNPDTAKQDLLTVSAASATNGSFKFINKDNGDTEKQEYSVDYRAILFKRNTTMSGVTVGACYATDNAETGANDFRRVMLYMEKPLSYNLGTLIYTLTSADFSD